MFLSTIVDSWVLARHEFNAQLAIRAYSYIKHSSFIVTDHGPQLGIVYLKSVSFTKFPVNLGRLQAWYVSPAQRFVTVCTFMWLVSLKNNSDWLSMVQMLL